MNKQLFTNITQAYVMSQWMAKFCERIGKDNYLRSPIRLEHGTGTGFFGVGNTGSTDCIKERFRGVTDNLGQRWSCWDQIEFVSESCQNLIDPNFRTTHRVEHTREVIDLYKMFEEIYIIGGQAFTPASLASWIIENQIVCLIEQSEQKSKECYSDKYPFSKYSSKILYQGQDISKYTIDDIKQLNKQRFSSIIQEINKYNFNDLIRSHTKKLLLENKKHTLPSMDLAVKYHNNEFELLYNHYKHKVKKRTNPNDKKWYSEQDTHRYNHWREVNEKV